MDVEIAVRALYMLGEAMSVRFFLSKWRIHQASEIRQTVRSKVQQSLTINFNSLVEPLSRYSPVMSHLSPSYRTVNENPIFSLKLQGALSTSINIWVYSSLVWMEDKPIALFVGTYRPANSHDSAVSLTINFFLTFLTASQQVSQSHGFLGNIILI